MKRKGFTMRLTMLGTGHALATKCYNACFALQDDAMGKAPGRTFLVDRTFLPPTVVACCQAHAFQKSRT